MLARGACNPYARRLMGGRRRLHSASPTRKHERHCEAYGGEEGEFRECRSGRDDRTTEGSTHEALGGNGERHERGERLQERGGALEGEDPHEGNDLEHEDDD